MAIPSHTTDHCRVKHCFVEYKWKIHNEISESDACVSKTRIWLLYTASVDEICFKI